MFGSIIYFDSILFIVVFLLLPCFSAQKITSVCEKDYEKFQQIFYHKISLSLSYDRNMKRKALSYLQLYKLCTDKKSEDYWNLKRISSSSMKCWTQLEEEADACSKVRYFMCYAAIKTSHRLSPSLLLKLEEYDRIVRKSKPNCSVLPMKLNRTFTTELIAIKVPKISPVRWRAISTVAPNPFIAEDVSTDDHAAQLNSLFSATFKRYDSPKPRRIETALCGKAPNYKPCISVDIANDRFASCCMQKDIIGCLPICSYDIKFKDLERSVKSGMCSAYKLKTYLQCASEGRDNSRCCYDMSRGIGLRSSTCLQFCAPKTIKSLHLGHRKCSRMIEPVMQCHLAAIKP